MNSFFNTYKKLADKIIPVMTNNNFVKTGMLTPDEFVEAGDYLVKNFTNWKWSKISKNKSLSFLPPDKQMLKMRKTYGKKQIFVETIDTNSWNILDNITSGSTLTGMIETSDDLDDLEEDLEEDDDGVLVENVNLDEKYYYITLTYDNYYRTPRIWFNIYDSRGIPLDHNNICKFLSVEHNKITVSMEKHPFLGTASVSVHPCKHSEVMKKLIKIELEHNKEISIKKYFIFFFKFVSCIIPQIDFDFTSST